MSKIKLTEQEQEEFDSASLLVEMAETKGWKEVFKPFLETKLNQSFPDPSAFTSESDFTYAAKTASVFKKVIAEILMQIQASERAVKYYQDKKDGKIIDNTSIGGD